MLHIEGWKRALIWATIALGLLFALPNGFYNRVETHNDTIAAGGESAAWPGVLPSGLVNLGLDLRGGAHLLGQVNLHEVYETRMESFWPEVRSALRAERATVGAIRQVESPAGELRVRIGSPENMNKAMAVVRSLARPVQSVLTGGLEDDIEVTSEGDLLIVTLSEGEKIATDNRTMSQTLEIIRRRVDEAGTREPTIQRQGDDRVLIQVPGIGSAQELKDLIGKPALLTFQAVEGQTANPNAPAGIGNEILPDATAEGVYYILNRTPVVTGEELVDAQPSFDQNGAPAVNFRFNTSGARKFGVYTSENIGSPFAIILDNEVISAPVIRDAITGGSGIITGNFDVKESTDLAILLRAGSLPASIDFLEERTVGPDLGQDSIDAGKIATIVAFIGVLVFMALAYGRFGMFANIALIINITFIFALLSMIGGTLTLPGIAGIVLTVGMAVDANVLIFERINEEAKTAKGPARAIERGYEKSLSAIIDANITTFIVAVILYVMGSGPVKGFAITLGLGIITSVFTAIFVTRLLVVMWFERARPKAIRPVRFRFLKEGHVLQFFKTWKLTFGFSVLMIVLSLGSFGTQGLNYGIDFKGGTTIRTESPNPVDVAAYRGALDALELGDVSITEVFDPNFGPDQNVALITIQAQDGQEAIEGDTTILIQNALLAVDADMMIPFPSVESVGGTVSDELIMAAIYAVLAAIVAVMVYIWLRFEWQFALGAVVALVHDVILTIGIFAVLQIKFDLAIIAALLTIVGYSLNDTVVVFDRVRENLRRFKKKPLEDVLNLSINETLSRTLMTSFTTLVALIALFVLGGDVIRGFVFAMIWGVVVGTYSSVFVASKILMLLGVKRDWSKPDNTVGNQFANVDA
ncbi:MAG: protein translocase subunit SecD [Planktomarina sp.]